METNHDFDSDDEDMVAEREEQQVICFKFCLSKCERLVRFYQ